MCELISAFGKWGLGSDWFMPVGAYPGFCSIRRLGIFLLPLHRMLGHRRSLPRNLTGFPNNSRYPFILLSGERHCQNVLLKIKTSRSRPRLEPAPLASGTNALTTRQPRLSERFSLQPHIFQFLKANSILHPKSEDFHQLLVQANSLKFCSQFVSCAMPSLSKVVCLTLLKKVNN